MITNFENRINKAIFCIAKKYKDKEGFHEYTDPCTLNNSLKKESLKTFFQILNINTNSEIISKIDKLSYCLSLIEFAAKVEIETEDNPSKEC